MPRELSVPVSLTGSGLPRIIPAFHRRVILRRDHDSDRLIQFYLSLFSINRIIPCTKKVTKSTFKSIVSPLDRGRRLVCRHGPNRMHGLDHGI